MGLSLFLSSVVLPGLILLIACVDDLRSRKIHNWLILSMLPLVLISVFLLKGTGGLMEGGWAFLLALAFGIPLSLIRVIGGGDLKLLALFAWTVNWMDFVFIFVYSLPWALVLGLFKIALDRKIKDFLFNLLFMFRHKRVQNLKFHSIPYSIALLFGWMSFLSLRLPL